jgi:hypothetical protein
MADLIHGDVELGATKETRIAAVVQRELIEGAVVAPRCMDWSFLAEPGAKEIEIPKGDSFTVLNRTEGSPGDASVITYDTDLLPLDFNAYISWVVDYKSKTQSRIDVQLQNAARAGRAHSAYLDSQLVVKAEAAGQATTTVGAISYAIILEMMETFLSNEGNVDQATLLVGIDSWAALMDINEFKSAEVYGSANIPSGVIGKVHGVDVVRSTKVGASSFYLYDKDALGFGIQNGPSFSEQMANEFGSQAKRNVLDQLFGTWAGFLGQKGAGAAESALIIKDNN